MHARLVHERKNLSRGRHSFLSEVIAFQRLLDRVVPDALVGLPADKDAVPTVVVVWLQHQRASVCSHVLEQLYGLRIMSRPRALDPSRPRNAPLNRVLLCLREVMLMP